MSNRLHPILRRRHIMMHGKAPTAATTAQASKPAPRLHAPFPIAPARRSVAELLSQAAHTLHTA